MGDPFFWVCVGCFCCCGGDPPPSAPSRTPSNLYYLLLLLLFLIINSCAPATFGTHTSMEHAITFVGGGGSLMSPDGLRIIGSCTRICLIVLFVGFGKRWVEGGGSVRDL